MHPVLRQQARQMKQSRRRTGRFQRILAVLCLLVVAVTTYAMIFPAITQTGDLSCKLAEHLHTSDCYQNELVLICEADHTHEEGCYDYEPQLICPLTPHVHDQSCATYVTPTDAGIAIIADEVYWKRVSSIEDTSKPYLIVPSGSSVALGVGKSGSYYSASDVTVTMTELAEAPGYYLAGGATEACQWNLTASGSAYRLKNLQYTNYGLNLGSSSIISTTNSNTTLTYTADTDTFTLGNGSYYLVYRNSSFSRSRSYAAYRPMVLYQQVDTLPDSGGSGEGGDGESGDDIGGETAQKPTYPDYVQPSGAQNGATTLEGVAGTYDADGATSQLESLFEGVPTDDGRIETDKSVTYGKDDYNAFAAYDPNTFGVTLSALGQHYSLSEEFGIKMPLDVVFVLDTSGSMINGRTSDNKSCAAAMIEALNQTMAEIYSMNQNNRVGVVCYSGQGHTLLELGRYTAPNHEFFPENSYTSNTATLTANSSIASLDGGTVTRGSFNKWYGTYTQSGIAMGAKLLTEADPVFNGTVDYVEDGQNQTLSYTVRRHPVMILLSDGDPTYATSEYNNVLGASKIYGNGQAGNTTNNQGVNGYYTILSAKYYKDQVSTHYNVATSFYTIGLGISETATNDSSGQSITGDHYKRAVLNPSAENVAKLGNTYSDDTNRSVTSQQLYKLLNNTFTSTTITLGSDTSTYNQYGLPHATDSKIPVIKNPYLSSGNSYAEESYFSEKMTASQLAAEFKDKIQRAETIPVYGLVLKANTTVCLTDFIGQGMELKGQPVLRYGGKNHAPTASRQEGDSVIYSYGGTYTATDGSGQILDLNDVTVTVTAKEGGQTVVWDIPDQALPSYTPHISASGDILYYYEALPIRCIYQVGLTDEAKDEIASIGKTGGTQIYYTNRWEDSAAFATIVPTDGNPYYADDSYITPPRQKAVNQTSTAAFSVSYITDLADGAGQNLGNNGRLVFRVSELSVPIEKVWDESVLPQRYYPVTAYLYLVKDDDLTVVTDATLSVTLNSENRWKTTLNVPVPPEGYHYYLSEPETEGYFAAYRQADTPLLTKTVTVDAQPVTAAAIDLLTADVTLTVENFRYAVLPPTGGRGTVWMTLGGIIIMVFAVLLLWMNKQKKTEKINKIEQKEKER